MEKANILLVNDQAKQLLALESILSPLGQELIKASSGPEALRLLLEKNFAVIMLDVMMPGMGGFETARLIRKRKKNKLIPIVFISATQFTTDEWSTEYSPGVVDYIVLPIEPDALRAKIRYLLEFYQKNLQTHNQLEQGNLTTENSRQEIYRQHHLELTKSELVNSIGEMASTLAHELNQPLTSITLYTQACIRKLQHEKSETISEILSVMNLVAQQAERAGNIIHRLKNFIRKGELSLEPVVLNEVIANLMPLIHYELYSTPIEVQFEFDELLSSVYVDKIQIEQVLINLIRNAVESMQEAQIAKPLLKISTISVNKQMIAVRVVDNGPGLAAGLGELIFTPYVTTKASGLGMGLAISRTIIEAHGGHLTTINNGGNGACFQFTLPVSGRNHHEQS